MEWSVIFCYKSQKKEKPQKNRYKMKILLPNSYTA